MQLLVSCIFKYSNSCGPHTCLSHLSFLFVGHQGNWLHLRDGSGCGYKGFSLAFTSVMCEFYLLLGFGSFFCLCFGSITFPSGDKAVFWWCMNEVWWYVRTAHVAICFGWWDLCSGLCGSIQTVLPHRYLCSLFVLWISDLARWNSLTCTANALFRR